MRVAWKKQQKEEKRWRKQRVNVPKPNQAWHARHRTWLGKIVQREESGQSKDFEEGKWYGSHTSTTATCEQSRPKQEGKDQASDTYEWLPCRWKKELSLADSSCTELTSMMCHKPILPDRWCVTIHTSSFLQNMFQDYCHLKIFSKFLLFFGIKAEF